MWGASKKRGKRPRGQSLTEFALVLPVFLLLTIVVIDGARAFMAQISLVNGVREAAFYAVQGHYADQAGLMGRLTGETSGLDPSRITLLAPQCSVFDVKPNLSCSATPVPFYVMIEATYQFDPITPGLAAIWGDNITLHASSIGRVFISPT